MNKSESKYFNTAAKMDEAFLSILETKDFTYITIKEICVKAGVNRSTFYLHYENICDLLNESVEYANRQFFSYMQKESAVPASGTENGIPPSELIFITPKYLLPYLNYVKANKRLFKTMIQNASILKLDKIYEDMFQNIFSPIMEQFCCETNEKNYTIAFYIHGLMAIIDRWLENDCNDPIEKIMDIMQKCIFHA